MKKIKILNPEIQHLLSGKIYSYPKYATQLLNLANQNAQGTRPKIVGQMSDLIQEFPGSLLDEWHHWYITGRPSSIDDATEKVWKMVIELKNSVTQIDKALVRQWVEELVIVKTFAGLKFQEAILKRVAAEYKKEYRLAKSEEESKGIDGFIGNNPVSIKPSTYKSKLGLTENIDVPIIFYEKTKDGIVIEFDLTQQSLL